MEDGSAGWPVPVETIASVISHEMQHRRELTPLRRGLGHLLPFPFLFAHALCNSLMPGKGLSPDSVFFKAAISAAIR